MSGRRQEDDGVITFVALIILAIIAMPIVGAIMFFKPKNDGSKILGIALMVFGVILWFFAFGH